MVAGRLHQQEGVTAHSGNVSPLEQSQKSHKIQLAINMASAFSKKLAHVYLCPTGQGHSLPFLE